MPVTAGHTCTCQKVYWGEGPDIFEAQREATAKCLVCIDADPDNHPLFTDDQIFDAAQRIRRALNIPSGMEVMMK